MKKHWRAAGRVAKTSLLAATAIVGVTLAILALRPAPEGVPVWVTTTPVAFGALIEPDGLELVLVPQQAIPTDAFTADAGPALTVADRYLPAGTTLSESDVRGSERTRLLQSGETLLEMPIPAGSSVSLQIGETIDLWGQVTECGDTLCAPERVAAGARVLQVTQGDTGAWGGDTVTLVALAVPSSATGLILQAETNQTLQYALRGAPG